MTPDERPTSQHKCRLSSAVRWGAMWRSTNAMDGEDRHLLWFTPVAPALFRTRHEARRWIETKYGYIRTRPDLKAEPHGWSMPLAVRVLVTLHPKASR